MTPAPELVPAATLPRARLAELFTAAYEGYQFPVRLDEAAFSRMVEVSDVDLERSPVAVLDGEPVGLALLGVRGRRGWVGGMGVVASRRRGGVGRALMEAVLDQAAGLETVALEGLGPGDGGAALVRAAGAAVQVLQLAAADEDAAGRLLAAARSRGDTLAYVNVPDDDPASAALRALGGRLDTSQLELARPLA